MHNQPTRSTDTECNNRPTRSTDTECNNRPTRSTDTHDTKYANNEQSITNKQGCKAQYTMR
ncbi:hypothetical protein ACMD2_26374 [Ananas comosus]|uniref:Uncharacterized protein n=1 Tax=Ananas comosus TaxID=4615 RepID=A0A199W5F9_ANACO|nr:hypothetical protein ACMD2_26374 [Ananas comosus]